MANTTFRHNGSVRLKTTRTFDQLNRLQAITHLRTPNAGVAVSSNYGYTLNDANQRTAMTQPNGQTWNWSYDSLGQSRRPGAIGMQSKIRILRRVGVQITRKLGQTWLTAVKPITI